MGLAQAVTLQQQHLQHLQHPLQRLAAQSAPQMLQRRPPLLQLLLKCRRPPEMQNPLCLCRCFCCSTAQRRFYCCLKHWWRAGCAVGSGLE